MSDYSPDKDRLDLQFWKSDEPHRAVFSLAERIDRLTQPWQYGLLENACLYGATDLAALIQGALIESQAPQTMTKNIVRRQVDAFTNLIVKNRPVPMAMTNEAGYGARRRAKGLTKLLTGALKAVDYYNVRKQRVRDSALWGSGFAHTWRDGNKITHERIFPWDLSVLPDEAENGKPYSLFMRKRVDRLALIERFPQFKEQILGCESKASYHLWDSSRIEETSDMALVRLAWRRPYGDQPGAHVIAISNATLLNVPYHRDYFPISKLDFAAPVTGWFGLGMVDDLRGLQFQINSIGLRLQESAFMTGKYVWSADDSGIEIDMLSNGALTQIKSALKPVFEDPAPFHPSFFEYYKSLGPSASDITGIPALTTHGVLPKGVESGKAIRTFHEIASESLYMQGNADEDDCVATAWQIYDLLEEIHDEGLTFEVNVETKAFGQTTLAPGDWKKIRADRKTLTLDCFPIAYLSTTPTEKWSQLKEFIDGGQMSQDEAVMLMDWPDLQAVLNIKGAERAVAEKIIEDILDSDNPKPVYPEPTMKYDLCIALGKLSYLYARWIDKVPEKNASVLLDFVNACITARDLANGITSDPNAVNGGNGPQPGSQDPNAPPAEAMPALAPPQDGGPLYAPPGAPPMPANAIAPDVMPPIPQV